MTKSATRYCFEIVVRHVEDFERVFLRFEKIVRNCSKKVDTNVQVRQTFKIQKCVIIEEALVFKNF